MDRYDLIPLAVKAGSNLVDITNINAPSVVSGDQGSVTVSVKNRANIILPTDPDQCVTQGGFGKNGYNIKYTLTVAGTQYATGTQCIPGGGTVTDITIPYTPMDVSPGTHSGTVNISGAKSGNSLVSQSFNVSVSEPTTSGVSGTGSATFTIVDHQTTITQGQPFTVTVDVSNPSNPSQTNFDLQVRLSNGPTSGALFLGETKTSISAGTSSSVTIDNPVTLNYRPIPVGTYDLDVISLASDGSYSVVDTVTGISVQQPSVSFDMSNFTMSGIPASSSVTLGGSQTYTVTVKNGNSVGATFKIRFVLNPNSDNIALFTSSESISPSTTQDYTFSVAPTSPTVSAGSYNICAQAIEVTPTSGGSGGPSGYGMVVR